MGIIILIILVCVVGSILDDINEFLKENFFTVLYVISFLIIGTMKFISFLDGSAFPLGYIIFSVVVFGMIKVFEKISRFFQGQLALSAIAISILSFSNEKCTTIVFLASAAIFIIALLSVGGFSLLKKINKSKHRFTIYYALICAAIAVTETILYKALPLHFAIFAVVVYILAALFGKIDGLLKGCVLFTSAMLFIQNFFEGGFIKTALLILAAMPVILFVILIICMIIAKKSYKSRIEGYMAEYVNNISNGSDRQNQITESSFFSQEKTKSLLREDYKVNGVSAKDFMKSTLKNLVIDGIKKEFMIEMDESKDKTIGIISFYYSYAEFLGYLKEQNIHLTEIIDSFGILNTSYWYIEDVAFFSDLLLQELMSAFEQKLKTVPKLAEVPFSKEFLLNYMYSNRFLDCYVSETDLDCLRNNPGLFKEEFDDLYSAMTNTEIDTSIKKNWIKKQPAMNEKGDYLYSVIHEDENGIIKEEYGKDFEQHRDYLDEDLSANQIDELAGCPV
ncbi:MAG: hypothetical protein NC177_13435 [Ruminococcus flavefaciens]|nr:hypothetical protein [Ruminococcus flavefaciens]